MKKYGLIFILTAWCFAYLPLNVDYVDGETTNKIPLPSMADRVLIESVGDIRAVLGPQGKSIAVSYGGEAIAVIYGGPTGNPQNMMAVKLAYSTDDGVTWTTYGPFSPNQARIYPGVDGSPDFDENYGELYYSFQETFFGYDSGSHKIIIEEGIPSAPSPSTPFSLPNSSGPNLCPWMTGIAVNPDDPLNVITTSHSYLNNGNQNIYAWVSTDAGYAWSDTIRVCLAIDPITGSAGAGHCRWGTGGYVCIAFHDTIDVEGTAIAYPHHIESTDGGYTWGNKQALPGATALTTSQFWWTELDCEVINNEPWAVHNDIDQTTGSRMWLFHGTGSPGSWTWSSFNVHYYDINTIVGDTSYNYTARQYPSISYDPVSGMILVSFKANYIKSYVPTADTVLNGPHIGGIYSMDGGATWAVTAPLSAPNNGQILSTPWSSTEVAHHLVNDNSTVYSYGVWVHEAELNLYFERGEIKPYIPVGIEENGTHNIVSFNFSVSPTITFNNCCALFTMPGAGNIALRLFDTTGRLVRAVYDGQLEKGAQKIDVNNSDLTSGTYFLILETKNGRAARKFVKL